jgi:hypothetical protein
MPQTSADGISDANRDRFETAVITHNDRDSTMSEATISKTTVSSAIGGAIPQRILEEGYGPGAWHGADLRAALDVDAPMAFWRPAKERHNIAEIAVHHAFTVHSVIERITGASEGDFPLDGSDWFPLSSERDLAWAKIKSLVDAKQRRLAAAIADIDGGRIASALTAPERLELALGVTCHAVYHAGQVQLIRALRG